MSGPGPRKARVVPMPVSAWLAAGVAALSLAGCERVQSGMAEQPSYRPGEGSALFADGLAQRHPPPGSVPYSTGDFSASSSGRLGFEAVALDHAAEEARTIPWTLAGAAASRGARVSRPASLRRDAQAVGEVDARRAWLAEGRENYRVFCTPCHGLNGAADGEVVVRGFPAPPSLHEVRLRRAPDRHFYDTITRGYGVMPRYGDRMRPLQRWGIVAYVRALQLAQAAEVDLLPGELRARLEGAPR